MTARRIERDVDDLALDPLDAALLRDPAEELSIETGIEVEGVAELRQRHRRIESGSYEPAEFRGNAAHRPFANVRQRPPFRLAKVELVELHAAIILAVRTEGMEVALAICTPIDELDPELERPLARREEFVLVDADHMVEGHQRRDRRLADSDRTDLV